MPAGHMAFDDLMAQTDESHTHELVRGEIVARPLSPMVHGMVLADVVGALGRYLDERATTLNWTPSQGHRAWARVAGSLLCGGVGVRFRLPDDPDQVRGLDLCYLTVEQTTRFRAALASDDDGYLQEMPALVVEVVSPFDTAYYIDQKVQDCLAGGARAVWLLYPGTRTVRAYSPDGTARTISGDGTLEGGEILPGFSEDLSNIFA